VSNRPSRKRSSSVKVRKASNAGRGTSTTWIWVGIVIVVVIAGLVAVLVSRGGGSEGGGTSPSGGTVVPSGDVSHGTVSVSGTALTDVSDGSTSDPAVGTTIPTVDGETFDGSPISIGPDGRAKVVIVAAHWCPHCQAEIPRLQQWLDDNDMPTDVDLVTIATANDPTRGNFPAGPWLRKEGWSVPTLVDDETSSAAQALGVVGYPTFVAVDADGKVIAHTSGEISMDQWVALLDAARS